MPVRIPNILIPEPLRAEESGTWAHSTVTVRFPEITRRVLAENPLGPEAVARLERLIADLPHGRIRLLDEPAAPDRVDWEAYVAPNLGRTWLTVPWFFAETYFYRRILEVVGYYLPGAGFEVDPFAHQKKLGLETSLVMIRSLSARVAGLLAGSLPRREGLQALLYADLWGNRADLSLWPADRHETGDPPDLKRPDSALLANDAALAAKYLVNREKPVRVDIVCDNAGFELVGDLLLGHYLLATEIAQELILHVKSHPTFVSDAIDWDVRQALGMLAKDGDPVLRQQGLEMQAAFERGQIRMIGLPFWTSPLSGWEMPTPLWKNLSQSSLIIVKGDANYRRLLGDRHWPYSTPFADILSYAPAPLLALRTLKAEVASGLLPERIRLLAKTEADWMTNGKWGVIQFIVP
jgi:uncharacterized protein with ATP-grasp and redox domains